MNNFRDISRDDFVAFYSEDKMTFSTFAQDVHDHIDIFYGIYSFDIKSKKAKRMGQDAQDEVTWIEEMNVRGRKGWLHGKATHIVFQYKDGYLFVSTSKIRDTFKGKVNEELEFLTGSSPKNYQYYRRKYKKDIIYLVPMKELEKIGVFDNEGVLQDVNLN